MPADAAHLGLALRLLSLVRGSLEEVFDDLLQAGHVDLLAHVAVVDEAILGVPCRFLRSTHRSTYLLTQPRGDSAEGCREQSTLTGKLTSTVTGCQGAWECWWRSADQCFTKQHRPKRFPAPAGQGHLNMICSRTLAQVRWRLLVMMSCSACSAEPFWPTFTSSSARLRAFSGFWKPRPPRWKRDMAVPAAGRLPGPGKLRSRAVPAAPAVGLDPAGQDASGDGTERCKLGCRTFWCAAAGSVGPWAAQMC